MGTGLKTALSVSVVPSGLKLLLPRCPSAAVSVGVVSFGWLDCVCVVRILVLKLRRRGGVGGCCCCCCCWGVVSSSIDTAGWYRCDERATCSATLPVLLPPCPPLVLPIVRPSLPAMFPVAVLVFGPVGDSGGGGGGGGCFAAVSLSPAWEDCFPRGTPLARTFSFTITGRFCVHGTLLCFDFFLSLRQEGLRRFASWYNHAFTGTSRSYCIDRDRTLLLLLYS